MEKVAKMYYILVISIIELIFLKVGQCFLSQKKGKTQNICYLSVLNIVDARTACSGLDLTLASSQYHQNLLHNASAKN